jgi:hypothetical protein
MTLLTRTSCTILTGLTLIIGCTRSDHDVDRSPKEPVVGSSSMTSGDGGSTSNNSLGGSGGTPAQEHPSCDPPSLTDHWDARGGADCEEGERCEIQLTCTAGPRQRFVFECQLSETDSSDDAWVLLEEECANVAESCVTSPSPSDEDYLGAIECTDGTWVHQQLDPELEARSPCPLNPPEKNAQCVYGDDFGADSKACGYPCANENWAVWGCDGTEAGEAGTWQNNGACDAADPAQGGAASN